MRSAAVVDLLHHEPGVPDTENSPSQGLGGNTLVVKAIGPRGAELLARCPYLTNLEELHLTHCRVGDAGLAALLTSPHLTRLTALDLWNNDLGDAAAGLLLAPRTQTRLSYPCLPINYFSPSAEKALRAAYGERADFGLPGER